MQEKHEKALGSPQGASTPRKKWTVQSRPSIKDYSNNKESILSPIPKYDDDTEDDDVGDEQLNSAQRSSLSREKNSSEGSTRARESSDDATNYNKQIPCTEAVPTSYSDVAKLQGNISGAGITITVVVVLLAGYLLHASVPNNKQNFCSVEDISKEFPTGTKDFWLSIQTALNDINKFNRPKSIIFLYESKYSAHLNKLLSKLSNVAECCIASCEAAPIQLKASDLNSRDLIGDYGKVITLYEENLRTNGVMVVRNLDQVPGSVAQVFHSFCDEYYPLVDKALFLFTVEVDTYPSNTLRYLEESLRSKWRDISEEKFYPLFTRITDLVLVIEEK